MKTMAAVLIFALSLAGQRHPGGMNNRYFPGANAPIQSQATSQGWGTLVPDITLGNTDFCLAGWMAPSATMIASQNGSATYASSSKTINLSYYSAQNPAPFLTGINNVTSPFGHLGPVPTADTWHLLMLRHDAAGVKLGTSLDGAAFVDTASSPVPGANVNPFLVSAGGGGAFGGAMARVAFWSRACTNTDATNLYNGHYGLRCSDYSGSLLTNLKHCWDLDSWYNTAAADGSPSGLLPAYSAGNTLAGNGIYGLGMTTFPDGGSTRPSFQLLNTVPGQQMNWEIDFSNGKQQRLIIAAGDSLNNGLLNNVTNSSLAWVMQTAVSIGPGYHYLDTGINGWQTSNVLADPINAAENAACSDPRWKSHLYVLQIGRNNVDAAVANATTFADVQNILSQRKSAGCTTVLMTTTPCGFTGTCNATTETAKTALNVLYLSGASASGITIPNASQLIYTGGTAGADYVVDSGNDTAICTAPCNDTSPATTNDTTLYLDKLHYAGGAARTVSWYITTLLRTLYP